MLNYLIVAVGIVVFYLYAPYFKKLDPKEYSPNLPLALEGPAKLNERLDAAERLYENQLHWPESLAFFEGNFYTGLGDGRIVRLTDKGVEDICRTGSNCQGYHEEHICGRPLGMEFSKDGTLYVADAYLGLFAVNVKTGHKKQLIESSQVVDGSPLLFLNSLVLDEEEQAIYLTQSSTRWNISMFLVSVLEHESSGRLLKYDMNKNTVSVLMNDLSFANGIVLSHDKKSVIFAEGNKHSISRYFIKGPQKAQFENLVTMLPGEPDNISRSKRGHYWVAVANARMASKPAIYDRISHFPLIRKGFLIMYHFLAYPVSFVLQFAPSKQIKEFAFELLNARILVTAVANPTGIIEFDEKGNVVQSLYSPEGKVSCISEAQEYNGYLYLGSWRNHYVMRVKI